MKKASIMFSRPRTENITSLPQKNSLNLHWSMEKFGIRMYSQNTEDHNKRQCDRNRKIYRKLGYTLDQLEEPGKGKLEEIL